MKKKKIYPFLYSPTVSGSLLQSSFLPLLLFVSPSCLCEEKYFLLCFFSFFTSCLPPSVIIFLFFTSFYLLYFWLSFIFTSFLYLLFPFYFPSSFKFFVWIRTKCWLRACPVCWAVDFQHLKHMLSCMTNLMEIFFLNFLFMSFFYPFYLNLFPYFLKYFLICSFLHIFLPSFWLAS